MSPSFLSNIAVIALCTISAAAAFAQDGAAAVNSEQARVNFARPVVLAPDDVRAFSAAPAGFAEAQPGGAAVALRSRLRMGSDACGGAR